MGHVYVRRSGDSNLFKIGKALDVEQRGKTLAPGNPEPLTLFVAIETEHAAKCETYLKERLRLRRSRRSAAKEFYECAEEELVAAIAATRAYEREVLSRLPEVARLARLVSQERAVEPGNSRGRSLCGGLPLIGEAGTDRLRPCFYPWEEGRTGPPPRKLYKRLRP